MTEEERAAWKTEADRRNAELAAKCDRINRVTRIAELAQRAPVTMRDAMEVIRGSNPVEPPRRSALMATWARLCHEWAAAMIDHAADMEKEALKG